MLPSIELSWKSGQHFAFRWKFSAKKPYLCLRGRGALWLYYFWNIHRCGKERRETTIPGNKYFRFYYFSWSNKIWMCSLSMSLFVWFKRIKNFRSTYLSCNLSTCILTNKQQLCYLWCDNVHKSNHSECHGQRFTFVLILLELAISRVDTRWSECAVHQPSRVYITIKCFANAKVEETSWKA